MDYKKHNSFNLIKVYLLLLSSTLNTFLITGCGLYPGPLNPPAAEKGAGTHLTCFWKASTWGLTFSPFHWHFLGENYAQDHFWYKGERFGTGDSGLAATWQWQLHTMNWKKSLLIVPGNKGQRQNFLFSFSDIILYCLFFFCHVSLCSISFYAFQINILVLEKF